MRALVVDDEAPARSRLRRQLEAIGEVEVCGEAEDGLQALEQISKLQPDLVFLDIQMPGLTGLEVLSALPRDAEQPLVIFVTGYDQYALAAFEANAVAYLLKPVQPERLAQTVERAYRLFNSKTGRDAEHQRVAQMVETSAEPLRQIVARRRDRMLLLRPADILYFFTEDGIVRAVTATESLWVNYQLNELERRLSKEQFFRASRAELINLEGIREVRPFFKSTFVIVMNDAAQTEISVGERRAKALRELIPGL